MRLSPEAREVLVEVAREQFTRRPTAEELWVDTVRLVREAQTPAEIEAAGLLVGRVTALGKMIVSASAPEPRPGKGVQFEEWPAGVPFGPAPDSEPPSPAAPAAPAPEPAEEEAA